MQQLKTVFFDVTYDEFERLYLYLKGEYGAELIANEINLFKTTLADNHYIGKRRHSATVPTSFPMGAEQWAIDLQAVV